MASFDLASLTRLPAPLGPVSRRVRRAVRSELEPFLGRQVRRQVDTAVGSAVTARTATLSDQWRADLEPVRTRLRQQADDTFSTRLLLGAGTRVDRALSAAHVERLVGQLAELTQRPAPELWWSLLRAYRSLIDAETRGLGRIAGSTPNVLAKLVATPLLCAPAGPVLEIGTLFGLFSPVLLHQFAQRAEFRALTVVDPFVGLQLQPGTSRHLDHTGTPVTVEVARANAALLGLPPERHRLITGYSGDPEVRADAGDRRYAVVVVDGDHSADGVLADLRWVETIMLPGAVAVLDDYGDPAWPGVATAVDAHLAASDTFELLGTAATSAFLRRTEA